MSYKRKGEFDYGDYNRNHKHLPYGHKGNNRYGSDDKFLIPALNKSSVRMKTKQAIKRFLYMGLSDIMDFNVNNIFIKDYLKL